MSLICMIKAKVNLKRIFMKICSIKLKQIMKREIKKTITSIMICYNDKRVIEIYTLYLIFL